ncbi:hypothetical protein B0H11DRAFT_2355885 [Mycena galericulata]|nr:hypothetical protein B0H11DRAFT_2355885 [Mycena galericulata]
MSDPFLWSSPEGYSLVRRILEPTPVPYVPHDHQLEGVCKSLDGVNLFAMTPTDPSLCPPAKFPENPCLLVICPTIPLQLEMADNMRALGLNALAINAETRSEARRESKDNLWMIARTKPNVVLTGPEQLKSADFEKALRDDDFYDRLCGTGFDEVHLLNTWGATFRKDFEQMGFVKARMPDRHNPWILTSATVRAGRPFDSICQLLGLQKGNYHLIRRSCARPDVQIIFRDLVSPISCDSFPEFDWVLTENRPIVMFLKSISLGSRIYAYLLRKSGVTNSKRIRLYNSLNLDSHNAETRELLKRAPDDEDYCQIIIGTDSLSVGVAMGDRLDALIDGAIDDSDDALQKLGRVNRMKAAGVKARCFFYISAATRNLAQKAVDCAEGRAVPKPKEILPDLSSARLILEKCKPDEIDNIYDNPTFEPPCTCPPCTEHPQSPRLASCICSGCFPDVVPPVTRPPRLSRVNTAIPKNKRLSKLQREHGTTRLLAFRIEIWKGADQTTSWMFPSCVFLPDAAITSILDNFVLLDTQHKIVGFIQPYRHLRAYPHRLLQTLQELAPEFRQIAADRKAENAAASKSKKLAEAAAENSEDAGPDAEMDDVQLRDVTEVEVNVPKVSTKGKRSKQVPKSNQTPTIFETE